MVEDLTRPHEAAHPAPRESGTEASFLPTFKRQNSTLHT